MTHLTVPSGWFSMENACCRLREKYEINFLLMCGIRYSANMKNDSFFVHQQGGGEPVSEVALRVLVEFNGAQPQVIGTATLLAPHLAVTAGHVLDDILERFGADDDGAGGKVIAEYSVRLIQILPGPRINVWQVFTAWKSLQSDLALLHLGIFKQSHPKEKTIWRSPLVHFTYPPVGSRINSFGYHSSQVENAADSGGDLHMTLNDSPTTSIGIVEEILPNGQPAGKFTFPCYRVNARYDGGMSGGPVFDESGHLRGIISGTYSGDNDPPISYVAMLWPLLPQLISIDRGPRHPRGVKYPLIHLVRDNFIHPAPQCYGGLPIESVQSWLACEAS